MVFSFLYRAFVSLLKLLISGRRRVDVKDIELLVLRHQLEVVRRQCQRPTLRPSDWALLAAMGRLLPPGRRHGLLVTRKPSCAGIASSCGAGGPTPTRGRGAHRSTSPRASSCCGWRARTRVGATSGSSASSASSAWPCRRAPFAGCSPRRALVRRQGARGRAGVSSCARRRRASSRATSSPSKRRCCAATTCCFSSSCGRAASTFLARRRIQTGNG